MEDPFMKDRLFCTVSQPEQASEAIERMQKFGYGPEEVLVAKEISEVERLMESESRMKRSLLLGVGYGALAGFVMGLGQMVFLGPTIWSMWGAAAIPIFNAGCWALVGSIVGCGGILGSGGLSPKIVHQFESEVAREKMLLSIPLHNRTELPAVQAALSALGATNIHFSGKAA
jgi:hypothetical protein